jgi:subtilisin family serine protease
VLASLPLSVSACDNGANPSSDTKGDPLYKYQWYLKNDGQPTIGDTLPVAGIDLNIGMLHEEGITGKGVTVGVADGHPIDSTQPDLRDNLIIQAVPPESAFASGPAAGHATAVAGIIGARAHNGIGGRGVAPDVKILDMSVAAANEMARPKVVNTSFGGLPPTFLPVSLDDIDTIDSDLNDRTRSLTIVSAGNSFLESETPETFGSAAACAQVTRSSGVGCLPASVNNAGAYPQAMLVAAINAAGIKASYSSTGSVVWVSALGGEYGEQRSYLKHFGDIGELASRADYRFSPAIVTTDRVGCDRGVKLRGRNYFDNRGKPSDLNPQCLFTANMNGTSAAAPMVTGIAALILQVNPALSWREIKYILATTARRIDVNRPGATFKGAVLEEGWVRNAAGHYFSNAYGFGLVNAMAAVEAARHFKPLPDMVDAGWATYSGAPVPVSDRSVTGGAPVVVDASLKIELVQVRVKTTHPTPNNLRVVVVSPSGTVSTVVPGLSFLIPTPNGFEIGLSASNAFLDENSKGAWRIDVIDVVDPSATTRYAITGAAVRVLGHLL